MYKFTPFAFLFLFLFCAILVNAGPIVETSAIKNDATDKEFVSMNKTGNSAATEKSQNMAFGKSMRPQLMALPIYQQPLVGSPLRFQRLGMPQFVVPRFGPSTLGHRLGGYSGYQQPPQMYSGYVQPAPGYTSPISYQHQPVIPSTYNYAPYASNSYSSYGGYRSAAEDDKLQLQPPSMDQPLQSSVQYETKTYVVRPQDYPADQPQYVEYNGGNNVLEYTASAPSEMQPREVLLMAPATQNEIGLQRPMMAGFSSPVNYLAPLSEPTGTDQVYWEERSPYGGYNVARPQQLDDYRLSEPSGHYLMPLTRSYGNLMNWPIQATGENAAPKMG